MIPGEALDILHAYAKYFVKSVIHGPEFHYTMAEIKEAHEVLSKLIASQE